MRECVSLSKWCHKLRNWRNYIIFKIRAILDRRNVSEVLSILELRNSFGLFYDYRVVTISLIEQKNKTFMVVPTPGAASMSHTRACLPLATFELHVETLSQRVSQFCKLGSNKYIVGVESGLLAELRYVVWAQTQRQIVYVLWVRERGNQTKPNQSVTSMKILHLFQS